MKPKSHYPPAEVSPRIPSARVGQRVCHERHFLDQRRRADNRLPRMLGPPAGRPRPVVQRPIGRTRRLPVTGQQPARPRTRVADRGNRRRCRQRHPRVGGRAANQPHLGCPPLRQHRCDQSDHRYRPATPQRRLGPHATRGCLGRRRSRCTRCRPRHQPDLKPGRSVCRAGRIRIDRNRGHPPPSGARRRYRQRLARPHIGIRGQQEKPHRGAHPPRHPLLA
jgi:hypothetical protein